MFIVVFVMSTEGVAVEQPEQEVVVTEQAVALEMPAPEKKPKARKEKKPKQARASSHPPYFQMIKEALLALDEKSGSSPYAIAKHMEEKHKAVLPANFRKILSLQLKNSVAKGNLIKIKASYKLSGVRKGTAKSDGAKRAKATSDPKKKSVKKSETPKKVAANKARKTVPSKVKQPRSIRSSAKKAKKVTT